MNRRVWTLIALLAVSTLALADEPLPLKLPVPAYIGTRKDLPLSVRQPGKKPRPPFLVPEGVVLLSGKKPVTSSDRNPAIGTLDQVTDGDKEGADGSYVELGLGVQWVQVDLGREATIHAVVVWHAHKEAGVYKDVVVQVASDPDFANPTTIFNNDKDNSSRLGIGKDPEYVETHEGELITPKPLKARYIRCYSNGNIDNDQNHYTEIEVFGIGE